MQDELSIYRSLLDLNSTTKSNEISAKIKNCCDRISLLSKPGESSSLAMLDVLQLQGENTLKIIATNKVTEFTANKAQIAQVITVFDGSLPSFPVMNGLPYTTIFNSSALKDVTDQRAEYLKAAINATGKIRLYNTDIGTGFLVATNLVITNRHVLQYIAVQNNNIWSLRGAATIDFGSEAGDTSNLKKRKITNVVFAGKYPIDNKKIDHTKTDIALIELEPDGYAPAPLPVTLDTPITPNDIIFAIGYPYQKSSAKAEKDVFELFFENYLGTKKVAPGNIITGTAQFPGRLCHNASTLGGNSGSLIVKSGAENSALAIHYGGTNINPRENWAHQLSYFSTEDNPDNLMYYFNKYNVTTV